MANNPKNIRRNATRPHASQRPYVQSMYGSKRQEKEIAEYEMKIVLQKKLEDWKHLK